MRCEQTNEHEERARVVAEARSWIGTPYHNQADIKRAGVDCGMLLVRIFVDCGLVEHFDPRPYSDDWFLHRSEEKYLGFVFDCAREARFPQPGDIMVFRYGRCYSHGAIVTNVDPLMIVHASQPARIVLEEDVARNPILSEPVRKPKFLSYWAGRE